MSRIILASSSPYRKELLKRLQLHFDTAIPDVDEAARENESPADLACRLATEKAHVITKKLLDVIVIGSDQVAECENRILGKPGNYANAREQLQFVSEKRVTFHTGLCVIHTNTATIQTDNIKTLVDFKKLSDEMIDNYLKKEPAFNCAGSFKSESLGIVLTKRIFSEDPTALIGLPLIRLTQMLEHIKYKII